MLPYMKPAGLMVDMKRAVGGMMSWSQSANPSYSLTKESAEAYAKEYSERVKDCKTDYRTGYGEHDGVNPDGYGDDDYILTGGIWGEGGFVALVHEGTDQPYYPEETPYYC